MKNKHPDIDLSFPMLTYGKTETPLDLKPLLYLGGAALNKKTAAIKIAQNEVGDLVIDRIELVQRLHSNLVDDLARGGSRFSVDNKVQCLRRFFAWADRGKLGLSLDSISDTFLQWADHQLHRIRIERTVSERSVYDIASVTATLFDNVLNRHASLIKETRIRKPRGKGKLHTSPVDKQNLQESFAFGNTLADICNSLTLEATRGPIPVLVSFRSGQTLEQWCGLQAQPRVAPNGVRPANLAKSALARRAAREAEPSSRTRVGVLNLRIEAELLMFIAQTGMNLQQAHTLRMDQYHYTSHLDGYQVRSYKNRRHGEVIFEIFSDYRDWFERYLKWRNSWFSDESETLLFPLIRNSRIDDVAPQFTCLIRICASLSMTMVRPAKLRGARVNWLLRETLDPKQTAELAQHSVETLIRVYADPHPQLAMVEIARFHQQNDPVISPPGPGSCVQPIPEPISDIPDESSRPDCINPAGCLFCTHHRDIESEDHVWSLSSFRHLKLLELARYRPPVKPVHIKQPALITVERLTEKLKFFEDSSSVRKDWVAEAQARIREGDYHPAWDGFIRLVEIHREDLHG
ncbi:hypothetical protein PS938_04400 [Pseudomonas fluorescens]|uniref:Integrase n=1 Tax=Pseudomonas fluorescens TaxID=294 RepID=A0A5E7V391_PSEFL|nr:site-specific integrase [Pseudomonas fluorescens]VVQ17305.1 hypothetical protein PS938_04400 [Pseudomonas fluorescens]